jgi:hypothetical protein
MLLIQQAMVSFKNAMQIVQGVLVMYICQCAVCNVLVLIDNVYTAIDFCHSAICGCFGTVKSVKTSGVIQGPGMTLAHSLLPQISHRRSQHTKL